MISVTCPTCSKLLKAPAEQAGRSARCPACGGKLLIPPDAAFESAAAPPPALNPYHAGTFAPTDKSTARRDHTGGDVLGPLSVTLGALALSFTLLGCLCGLLYPVALLSALGGLVLGLCASGPLRLIGIILNAVALVPVLLALGFFLFVLAAAAFG